MQWKGLRLPLIIAALIVMMTVLYVGQNVYQKFTVSKPLNETYSQIEAVKDYQINNDGSILSIEVEFEKGTELKTAYQEILNKTGLILNDQEFQIIVKEKANKDLKQVLYNSQFAIHEAIALGNYTEMYQAITGHADALNVTSEIYIEDDSIYLYLSQNDNYVFRVFEKYPHELTSYAVSTEGRETVAQRN